MRPTMPPEEEEYAETESARKLKKLRFFSSQCSRVLPHVFVAGDKVAQDRQVLLDNGICRILNCASTVLPCHHESDTTLKYYKLPLLDSPEETICRYFYPVLSMMEECDRTSEPLLVHCHQGVSRSCTFVVAYLMWKQGLSYTQAFHSLREARGVGEPNSGFICQLIDWEKRRKAGTGRAHAVYLSFPSDADAYDTFPGNPWLVKPGDAVMRGRDLFAEDSCIIVHTGDSVLLCKGAQCSDVVARGAVKHTEFLTRFEGAPAYQEVAPSADKLRSIVRDCGFDVGAGAH